MATFTGTAGNDVANATTGTLIGFTGGTVSELQNAVGDTFNAGSGADTIVAGSGNDTINGGLGADSLDGGSGGDVFHYTNFNDAVAGEVINGGSGSDVIALLNGSSADFQSVQISSIEAVILGYLTPSTGSWATFSASQLGAGLASNLSVEAFSDSPAGSTIEFRMGAATSLNLSALQLVSWSFQDNVVVNGDADAESVVGTGQRDIISLGDGNDSIYGGGGLDQMYGEGGSDQFVISEGDIGPVVGSGETIDGGTTGSNRDRIVILGENVFRDVNIFSIEELQFTDILFAAPDVAWFWGHQFGGSGISNALSLFGSSETDTINVWHDSGNIFDMSAWQFTGWSANDVIHISQDNGDVSDTIIGSSVRDIISTGSSGGGGDDTITGGHGADEMHGGIGSDTFLFIAGDVAAGEIIDGGGNTGTTDRIQLIGVNDFSVATIQSIEALSYSVLFSGVDNTATFAASQFTGGQLLQSLAVTGSSQVDTLVVNMGSQTTFSGIGFSFSSWTAGTDRVIITGDGDSEQFGGTSQSDSLAGGGGDDLIAGLAGNDTLIGGLGQDTINGGNDNDVMFATHADGNDTYTGGNGFDILDFSQVNGVVQINQLAGTVTGSAGNDTLSDAIEQFKGTAFGDVLSGGHGINVLDGEGGADQFFGNNGDDLMRGGTGDDTFFFSTSDGNDTLLGGDGFDILDYSTLAGVVQVNQLAGTTTGTANNDTLSDVFEQVIGTAFGDVLSGGHGINSLKGNGGDDQLFANNGDDYTSGGDGNDTITMGVGNDTHDFRNGEDTDTILDFTAGGSEDTITLTHYTGLGISNFAQLQASGRLSTVSGHAELALDGGDRIIFNNVASHTLLTAADFIFA